MSDKFKAIRDAVAARDSFLAEHPELQPFQYKIVSALASAGSQHNRMVVLSQMMAESAQKLRVALLELKAAAELERKHDGTDNGNK